MFFFRNSIKFIYPITSLIPNDIINKWGYYTSDYTRGIAYLNQAIRVVKNSQIFQLQRKSELRVPLSDNLLTPYTDSQVGWLYGQKDNHHTLILRDSGNYTSPTVKALTYRGSHKTPFHT